MEQPLEAQEVEVELPEKLSDNAAWDYVDNVVTPALDAIDIITDQGIVCASDSQALHQRNT